MTKSLVQLVRTVLGLPEAASGEGMSSAEKDTIRRFAAGDATLRDEAIRTHRRNIEPCGVRGNAHQRFMAEVDTPSPDLALRARYRDELLAEDA